MTQYIGRFTAPLALSFALVLGACGGDSDDSLAADSSLARDLELANADSLLQPELNDVPEDNTPAAAPTPAPVRPAPRPSTPAPRPSTPAPKTTAPAPQPERTASGNTVEEGTGGGERLGTIASGTTLSMRSSQRVCTNTNQVGDRFTATLDETVTGASGASIPAGSTVVLEVTEVKRSENANDPIRLAFAVRSVRVDGRNFPVSGVLASEPAIERVRASSTGNDAKKVAAGAIIGAIVGQVIGKDTKGTVIGGATGAAAGTAAAAATANYDGCLAEGTQIVISLTEDAQITAG
ncbi:MAG TPA: hypothetical protein VKZ41_12915 [Gemmatimonadales bacterium]|nr:hypothetical protein [Gemmatimonadales bacterium]